MKFLSRDPAVPFTTSDPQVWLEPQKSAVLMNMLESCGHSAMLPKGMSRLSQMRSSVIFLWHLDCLDSFQLATQMIHFSNIQYWGAFILQMGEIFRSLLKSA